MQYLREIDISNNMITDLPLELATMPNLQTLDCYSNPFNESCLFKDHNLIGVFKILEKQKREKINVGILQIPDALRSAVQEYLVYFDEYYEEISGKKIGFKVSKHEIGLQIEVDLTKDLDILSVQNALTKYTQHLLDKKFDIENDVEVDKLVKDLQILKLTLETKANHFDQQMKILEVRHQLTDNENKYLRQIVAQFASKDNIFNLNQQTTNQNSPKLINTSNININNQISSDAFRDIADILKEAIGDDKELSDAVKKIEESTQVGKRSAISSALSNFANIITNSIDKAHIFLVDAPEVVEKLKKSLEFAKTIAGTHHYTEVAKLINNIINMFLILH